MILTRLDHCSTYARRLGVTMFAIVVGFSPTHGQAAPVEATTSHPAVTSNAPPALFAPITATAPQKSQAIDRGPQVLRARAVAIASSLLTQPAVGAPKAFGPVGAGPLIAARSVTLNLFDDVTFIADADNVERTVRGITWVGHLRGIENSQVILVINDDVVVGNISMPAASRYHIRYVGGAHEVQEIDQSKFPVDEHSVPTAPKPSMPKSGETNEPKAQADDGSVIDVMVIYSTTTRIAAGGTTPMRAEIDLGIAETNQSYFKSNVVQRVRLVHADEMSYNETGVLDDALECITDRTDGCLDSIHAARDLYAADLVSLWVEKGDACGIGWWDAPSVAAAHGFSVVQRDCATGTYSFGHELGHNMGAHHDVHVKAPTAENPYGHGFVNLVAGWRTVMAYVDACDAIGKKCPRIQYWSNPSLTYNGAALGNVIGQYVSSNFFTPVPEPSSAIYLLAVGLFLIMKRRNRLLH